MCHVGYGATSGLGGTCLFGENNMDSCRFSLKTTTRNQLVIPDVNMTAIMVAIKRWINRQLEMNDYSKQSMFYIVLCLPHWALLTAHSLDFFCFYTQHESLWHVPYFFGTYIKNKKTSPDFTASAERKKKSCRWFFRIRAWEFHAKTTWIKVNETKKNNDTRWCPSYVCWFIIPMNTIDITP